MKEYIDLIIAIVCAIPIIVDLAKKLFTATKNLIKEKNYFKIIKVIYTLVADAENTFANAADKKVFVLDKVKALCAELKVEYDEEKFGKEIDELIAVTKNVNKK